MKQVKLNGMRHGLRISWETPCGKKLPRLRWIRPTSKMHFSPLQDGRRKARLVAGCHMTGPNTNTYYSSVVSLRAMRMRIFLAELIGMDLIAADI
eukprot:14873874-Ditylum_brightwellii.AAC.1